jgi:hypothetical protein
MIDSPLFWVVFAIVLLFGFVVFRGAPYVPSRRKSVELAFTKLYKLRANDTLLDIGSGDGLVLRAAAKMGVKRAIGYELNPALVIISRLLSRKYPTIEINTADFWYVAFPSDVTVVYLFIVSRDSLRMEQKLQAESDRLGKAFRVITFGASLPSLNADKTIEACRLYTISPLQDTSPTV